MLPYPKSDLLCIILTQYCPHRLPAILYGFHKDFFLGLSEDEGSEPTTFNGKQSMYLPLKYDLTSIGKHSLHRHHRHFSEAMNFILGLCCSFCPCYEKFSFFSFITFLDFMALRSNLENPRQL